MTEIRNKTHKPLRVPLPQGKILHLNPNQTGQISHHAVDHEPLKKLVEAGDLEILGEGGKAAEGSAEAGEGGHAAPHGHPQQTVVHPKGNRGG